jgi:hypothetical protein
LCAISVVLVLSPSSLMLLLAPVAADFDAIVMDRFWPKYVGNGLMIQRELNHDVGDGNARRRTRLIVVSLSTSARVSQRCR